MYGLMKVRLLQQYRSYKRGDIIEVSQRMAVELAEHGIAVEDKQAQLGIAERREAAVAARVNVRTADRR
jgi:hypothetical protein